MKDDVKATVRNRDKIERYFKFTKDFSKSDIKDFQEKLNFPIGTCKAGMPGLYDNTKVANFLRILRDQMGRYGFKKYNFIFSHGTLMKNVFSSLSGGKKIENKSKNLFFIVIESNDKFFFLIRHCFKLGQVIFKGIKKLETVRAAFIKDPPCEKNQNGIIPGIKELKKKICEALIKIVNKGEAKQHLFLSENQNLEDLATVQSNDTQIKKIWEKCKEEIGVFSSCALRAMQTANAFLEECDVSQQIHILPFAKEVNWLTGNQCSKYISEVLNKRCSYGPDHSDSELKFVKFENGFRVAHVQSIYVKAKHRDPLSLDELTSIFGSHDDKPLLICPTFRLNFPSLKGNDPLEFLKMLKFIDEKNSNNVHIIFTNQKIMIDIAKQFNETVIPSQGNVFSFVTLKDSKENKFHLVESLEIYPRKISFAIKSYWVKNANFIEQACYKLVRQIEINTREIVPKIYSGTSLNEINSAFEFHQHFQEKYVQNGLPQLQLLPFSCQDGKIHSGLEKHLRINCKAEKNNFPFASLFRNSTSTSVNQA